MKKIITITALITIAFSTLQTNAQPPWAKAYGHEKHDDRRDYRDDRRDNYHDKRNDDYRDEGRGNYRYPRQVYRAPHRSNYYYYPHANVYYNPYARNYSYLNNGAWISVNNLPRDVYLDQQYQEVYCDEGENIWDNNQSNVDYYRQAPRPVYMQPARPRVAVGINLGVRF